MVGKQWNNINIMLKIHITLYVISPSVLMFYVKGA